MAASYSDQIRRAKAGEVAAFGEVVVEFQDMAFAIAYGWLGDREAARDVAQDAFMDAYVHLGELRTPEAFPGWFKRIILKHCDRATRRKPLTVEASADLHEDPLDAVAESQNRRRARALVEALPPKERIVVALQYFAELTGPEIADLMDLPLSTVKKRLRSARSRLRQSGATSMVDKKLVAPGPLSDEVVFFIALRNGDRGLVAQMLRRHPSLANATQSWDPALAEARVLPFPNHATALIVAIELDDLPMLQILLEGGADADGQCGCRTAETPLWAAALFDRPAHAERLLAAGANPDAPSSSGNYPLHLAAMRGNVEVARVLLDHGADAKLKDCGPKWPPRAEGRRRDALQWAEAKGHDRIAELIRFNRAAAGTANVKPANTMSICDGVAHTGIKAVDLFAPIPHGRLTRVIHEPKAGVVVLLGEISRRWLDADLGPVIWTGFAREPIDRHDWEADLGELGIEDLVKLRVARLADDEDVRLRIFDDAIASACGQEKDTLLVIISNPGFEHYVEASYARLMACGHLTCLVVVPQPHAGDLEPHKPFAAQIRLDPVRTRRLLLPPIDPEWSSSETLQEPDAQRAQLSAKARKLIADYLVIDPGLDHVVAEGDVAQSDSARKLMAYLRQPFFITEPFTGTEGEFVSRKDLLASVAAIV